MSHQEATARELVKRDVNRRIVVLEKESAIGRSSKHIVRRDWP